MSPSPFAPHERLISRLVQAVRNQIDQQSCRCEVYAGLDWIVSDDTVVRPDLMVVCGDQPDEHLHQPPQLVIEVLSPSTADKDRHAKYALYEQQGVLYYLLAQPAQGPFEGFKLVDGRFQIMADVAHETLTLRDGCQLSFDPASF